MARRTIEISREKAHLAVELGQLLIIRDDERRRDLPMRQRLPCEDLGLVIVDHREVSYSHHALVTLASCGAGLVVCGEHHLPVGLMLPMSSHTEQVWRVNDQINCGKVLRKQLWTSLVRAKIRAQAGNISSSSPAFRKLERLARSVRSGDPDNTEAQAARVYWQALFPPRGSKRFRRLPGEREAPNSFLDYGYAVLRAAVARALVGAGLLPVIGIHHSNRSNAFCLADDLIEPLRPMIDRRVRRLFAEGRTVLDQPTKAELLLVLSATVLTGAGESQTRGPLDAALTRYAASLASSLAEGKASLLIPTEPTEEGGPCPS